MTTDKYDLHTIDYSVQGWDAIMTTDMEKIDDSMQTRLLVTLGETVEAYKAVYISRSTGKFHKALANLSKQPALGITCEAGVLDDTVRIQRVGALTNPAWSWAVGKPVFLSASTPGELTQEVPPAAGRQLLGIASASTTIILSGVYDSDVLPSTTTTTSTTTSTTTASSTTVSVSSTSSTSSTVSTSSSSSTSSTSTVSTTTSSSTTTSTTV
ncbi:MAG: hypothetical protein DRJ03_29600 [Chloroflexi bacterium]|nr:MAG: hypothetical protein DRJ03_29600 [Chloroflexota bacterium]